MKWNNMKEETFNIIKQTAIELWKEIDTDNDKYGYATEKINRIKDLENIKDNFGYIINMFDYKNQWKLLDKLKGPAKSETYNYMLNYYQDGEL